MIKDQQGMDWSGNRLQINVLGNRKPCQPVTALWLRKNNIFNSDELW